MNQDLLHHLVSGDWRERHEAVELISQIGDEQLARAVLEIVRSSHTDLSSLSGTLQALEQIGRSLTGELTALLKSPDRDLHIYTPLVLGAIGDPAAIPALVELVRDPSENENARFNAIEALGRLESTRIGQSGREQVIPALRQVLAEATPFLRYAAVLALGQCADPTLIPDLLPLLEDAYLSEPAITALGQLASLPGAASVSGAAGLSGAAAVPEQVQVARGLTGWLNGEYASTAGSQAAVTALSAIAGSTSDPQAVRRAVTASINSSGRLRLLALAQAQETGSCMQDELAVGLARLLGWLLSTEQGEDGAIRSALARLVWCPAARPLIEAAFSESPLPIPDALVEMLNSGDPEQSISAARFLVGLARRVETSPARSALAEVFTQGLETGEEGLVALSAEGLGSLGYGTVTPQQVGRLAEMLALSSPSIRITVIEALASLQPEGLGERIAAWLEDPNPNLRESALRLMAALPASDTDALKDASSAALAALVDPSPEVRRAAVELLPRYKDPQAVSAIAQVMEDPDERMRISAVRACAELSPNDALPLLYRAVQDDDHWVRMHAVRALCTIAHPESLPAVAFYLRDPFPPVRIAAIEGIARFNDQESAQRYLRPLLEDEDYEVRRAVQAVLEGRK